MAYFMTTPLGYSVPLNDWKSFHRDRLLSVLYQMHQAGVPTPGFESRAIAEITGLPNLAAIELAEELCLERFEGPPFLKRDGYVYRLTRAGLEWAQQSPGR